MKGDLRGSVGGKTSAFVDEVCMFHQHRLRANSTKFFQGLTHQDLYHESVNMDMT